MTAIDEVGTRRFHATIAAVCAALMIGVVLATLPVADRPWGAWPWLQAVYLMSVFLLDGLTALILALQSMAAARQRALAWLAGGYLFTAVMAKAQLLAYPGIVTAEGVLGGGQTALWLWVFWHAGFPCFVLAALAVRSKAEARPAVGIASARAFDLFPMIVGFLAALGAVFLPAAYSEHLPTGIEGGDYRQFRDSPLAGGMVMLNAFTLWVLVYVTRLRALLHLWLAVVLLAFNLDVLLSMGAGARGAAGWHVARALSVASAGGLLVALLIQYFWLHRNAEIRAAFHEDEARHDPLTGLFNRRYLNCELAEELGRAQRYRHPLSVLMLDLDHFKGINDRHGHVIGDECLAALAQVLSERVGRLGDFAARYGGEEFVIVLPETGCEGAREVAEEIRQRVEALHGRGAAPCPMTVSIGVATASSTTPVSVEALLAAADAALYRAKEEGRNRVAGPPKASGPTHFEPRIA